LEARLDPARRRDPALDPLGREDLLALGSLVEYLALSAPALGYRAEVAFVRSPEGPRSLVTLLPLESLEPEPLFGCLTNREEHGGAFRVLALAEVQRERFAAAVRGRPGVRLDAVWEPDAAGALGEAFHGAVRRIQGDEARLAEVAAWLREGERAVDGIPFAHAGLRGWQRARLLFKERFDPWNARREVARRYLSVLGDLYAPAYLVLSVEEPGGGGPGALEAALFEAGRCAARLGLTALDLDLALQSASMLLEDPALDEAAGRLTGLPGAWRAVWVARTGVPERPDWPRLPRRGPEAFFV
jgi:hypothetical protein